MCLPLTMKFELFVEKHKASECQGASSVASCKELTSNSAPQSLKLHGRQRVMAGEADKPRSSEPQNPNP